MPENRSAGRRLDSWKEIAAYLHRDTRTAIRWGKEKGLPVHRVPGGKRQAVFAYSHEIDAWLGSQEGNGAPHSGAQIIAKPQSNGPNASNGNGRAVAGTGEPRIVAVIPAGNRDIPLLRRGPLAMVLLLLLGLAGIGAVFTRSRTGPTIRSLSLRKLTDDGRGKGNLKTDGTTLYFVQTEGARAILVSAPVSGGPSRPIETPFSNVALQDLSNDGRTLLITSYEGILIEGPLWTTPVQGGTPRRVGEAVCSQARWSPDNRRIVCAGRTTLTVMNADGSSPYLLSGFSSPVGQVLWSPDGTRLRFTLDDTNSHTSSTWEIAADRAEGVQQPQRIPMAAGCCIGWTWLEDGKTLAYVELDNNATGKEHLILRPENVPPGRLHETELPVKIGFISALASARTGHMLYLLAGSSYRGELLKFDPREKALQTYLPGISATFLAFSPNGQWITYIDTVDWSLWRSRADGSEALRLTDPAMHVQVSAWSPDGQRIAFMGQEPDKPWRIYLIGRDGGPTREAAEGNDNQGGPSWSPDGKTIVYGNVFCEKTQNCWIRLLDLASRKTKIIAGSNGFRTARWSPDGKYIAALNFQARELMLFDVARQRWQRLADSVAGDNINWSADSQFVYADSPRDKKPVIERVRVPNGQRTTVVDLASLNNVPGQLNNWMGITPDNAPILCHIFSADEVYEMKWADQ